MDNFVGKSVGNYQIVEIGSQNDTSTTYKGFQPGMNRFVMVQFSKSQDPIQIYNFAQQTELMARIQHANILPVYDSGAAEGLAYRVLRFAEGGLLRDHLNEFREMNRAAALFSGITAGLEKIHEIGSIHGNLQPGAIYLDASNQALLTDFGATPQKGLTAGPFMSPEQIQGGIVDRRSDVYSLGVLLYTLLTGTTPPPGVVLSVRGRRPDLPESVEKIIFKAMAQSPDLRFQSVREFASALAVALQPAAPASIPAAAAPAYYGLPRKGTNWILVLLGVVVLAIIFYGAGSALGWWGGTEGSTVVQPGEPPVATVPAVGPPPTEPPAPAPTQLPESPVETVAPDTGVGTQMPAQPIEKPASGAGGIQLPAACSGGALTGGLVLLGGAARRRSSHVGSRRS